TPMRVSRDQGPGTDPRSVIGLGPGPRELMRSTVPWAGNTTRTCANKRLTGGCRVIRYSTRSGTRSRAAATSVCRWRSRGSQAAHPRRVRSVPTFVLRLIAPRPDFAQTMTDSEREIMNHHAAHWRPYLDRGDMVVFGPVLTEDDSYGLAV